MAYTDNRRPADRAASVAGVIAVHAALGYVLVIGLRATGMIPADDPPLVGTTVVDPLPLPPPPPPEPAPREQNRPNTSQIHVPDTVVTLNPAPSDVEVTEMLPPPGDFVAPSPGPVIMPSPGPAPRPLADPVAAAARNDPGGWITQADYRTSWIARGWAGTAGFRLAIGRDGRVEECRITRSTGHTALDQATCALVTRRARFEPARDGAGEKVAGSYASSVLWQIPD